LSKKEKKIEFFSIASLELLLKNFDINSFTSKIDFHSSFEIIGNEFCCLKDEISLTKIPEIKRLFLKEIISPKTKVHSETKEDSFYFQTDLQLIPMSDDTKENIFNPHYYFIMKHSLNSDELKKFTACLRILADEGLGGDRSSGKGKFEDICFRDIELSFKSENSIFLNLSIFNPKDQDEFDKCIYYELIKRGGGSLGEEGNKDHHRKQVRMITEGSIIKGEVKGRLVDVSPFVNFYQHKIYRNGKAFLIPIG
jgi:CRISPR-associated protein Csm4